MAAAEAGVPVALVLACGQAESGWDKRAERWGWRTAEAVEAIVAEDWVTLQAIVDEVAPDISYGASQRVVLYHWYGTREHTVTNCLAVRAYVFTHPAEDVANMAEMLAGCLAAAADYPEPELQALIAYNSGSPQPEGNSYWQRFASHVEAYRQALTWAKEQIGG